MNVTAYRVHKFWVLRAALVLVASGLVECVVVWFAQRPIFWATLIASSVPFSMVLFVAMPMLREEKRKAAMRRYNR